MNFGDPIGKIHLKPLEGPQIVPVSQNDSKGLAHEKDILGAKKSFGL